MTLQIKLDAFIERLESFQVRLADEGQEEQAAQIEDSVAILKAVAFTNEADGEEEETDD